MFITSFSREAQNAEDEIEKLTDEVMKLEKHILEKTTPASNNEIVQLLQENSKLNHRLTILTNAIMNLDLKSKKELTRMPCIQETLVNLFEKVIKSTCADIINPPVIITVSSNNPKFGDFQCNSAMPLSNIYKQLGKKLSPVDVAKRITENIEKHESIDKLEIAGPGFINIFLNKAFCIKSLNTIFEYGVQPPMIEKKFNVLIDFSSPNIAKEMHVGHLRSTIIGDSISRLLEFLGHNVLRINHVGDWGTQFGMLIAYLQEKCSSNCLMDKFGEWNISDLQTFYKESKLRFDQDKEFKKHAQLCVVKLQSLEPEYINVWQKICDISRWEFQKIYQRLNIRNLTEKGESFYQSRMTDIVQELDGKGFLIEDEGRKILWGEDGVEKKGVPLTIVKSDGGYTYDTSDLAALKYRLQEENIDWIIYVTDAGQSLHFQTLFKCAKKIGLLNESSVRLDHVPFGVVLGENRKKFKTRSGETVRLLDLLDQGLKRALDKLLEKNRDKELTKEELEKAQKSVAYGCIKYADLSHNRNHEYVFSFDKMLDDKGNTAVYLLYAYTRIKSIARNAQFCQDDDLKKENAEISLQHEKEWKLGKVLVRFPDELLKVTKYLCLHHLCEYLYEMATAFTEFYDSCYCIEKNANGDVIKINYGRILLAEATCLIMEKCFFILGLEPVSKM